MLKHLIQKILAIFSYAKPTPEAIPDVVSTVETVASSQPIPEPVIKPMPEVITKKIEIKTKSQLLAMTKDKLEEHGRTIGIELDKRKTKNALVEQLLNHQMSLKGE